MSEIDSSKENIDSLTVLRLAKGYVVTTYPTDHVSPKDSYAFTSLKDVFEFIERLWTETRVSPAVNIDREPGECHLRKEES